MTYQTIKLRDNNRISVSACTGLVSVSPYNIDSSVSIHFHMTAEQAIELADALKAAAIDAQKVAA